MQATIRHWPDNTIVLRSIDNLTSSHVDKIGEKFDVAQRGGETFQMQGTDGRKVWIGTDLLRECTLSFEGEI